MSNQRFLPEFNLVFDYLASLNPILSASGGVIFGFIAGFITRWYFFRKKTRLDLANSYISDLENSLAKMFEEAITYLEKIHTSDIDLQSYTEIRRQLMVSRMSHARKIVDNLNLLNSKSYPIPDTAWIELRKTSDSLFDKPKNAVSLSALAHSISDLSKCYTKPSI